jgi:Dyp-type peroxidase family
MTANIIQDGIFYSNGEKIGKSFCIIFFNFTKDCDFVQAKVILKRLWKFYNSLKKGITRDLIEAHPKQLHTGNTNFLLGYGSSFFSINGFNNKKPNGLEQSFFNNPDNLRGGGPVVEGINIFYNDNIKDNHAIKDQIIIQCIAENDYYIYRVIVESYKELQLIKKENNDKELLLISKYYLGHKPEDRRNWFGFLDGISNINKKERKDAIFIKKSKQGETELGTYMAFSRIEFNLEKWDKLSKYEQEIIIGREKLTGCPVIGVDEVTKKTIKDPRCPIPGTISVLDHGNEVFREINPLAFGKSLPPNRYKQLKESHITASKTRNWKIFRQSFEFFEPSEDKHTFKVGFNFISFQNDLQQFFELFRHSLNQLTEYFSIHSIGIFYIPPIIDNENFPGEITSSK